MSRFPTQVYRRLPRQLPRELRFSNYALLFNGSTNYIEVANSVSLQITGAITVEAWMKRLRTGTEIPLGKALYQGVYFVNDNLKAVIRHTTLAYASITNEKVTDTLWHHYLWTYDFAGDHKIHIYLDGVECTYSTQNTVPIDYTIDTDIAPFSLGRHHTSGLYFMGLIDEVRVLPTYFSPSQVRNSFQTGYARRELDCRAVIRMEEASGLTAYDDSGYGNNGSFLPALTPPVWTPVAKYELLAEARV